MKAYDVIKRALLIIGVLTISKISAAFPESSEYAVPDTSHVLGQIQIVSGVSPTGAKTYEIPIETYPGMNGLTPKFSLVYNSQHGNSVVGRGWAISGLSVISRSNKNIYFDGKPKGISMKADDAFVLDGVRLIHLRTTGSYAMYETETGNIKARAVVSGDVVKYFEVFYPDGRRGIFGIATNKLNSLCYPITSVVDMHGNKINYSYTVVNNCYNISNVTYNGASIEFKYSQSRSDPLRLYSGGQEINGSKLLSGIVCKIGSNTLGEYTLAYSTRNKKTFLSQVGYKSGSETYSPICLYYGTGQENTVFALDKSVTLTPSLNIGWNTESRVVGGVFGNNGDVDGIVIIPNRNPYWKHHRSSGTFHHSQNQFINYYDEREEILLHTGFRDTYLSSKLMTGDGFIDLITADLKGCQKENLIRINNTVAGNDDRVTFYVYGTELHSKPIEIYRDVFNFPTVYTDADGGKSVQPKYYYAGDFNGDGKAEVMAVSVHQPFGDTGKPSKCYVFDLLKNKVLYQNHVFPFNVDFVGTEQSDAKAAVNNTDKLLVIDYDGDGKSDICHINESGINVYTFDVSGETYTARKVATDAVLNKAGLANRDIFPGDFNGDGLTDLLVSPSSEGNGDVNWSVYNSKGNGTFAKSTFRGPAKGSSDDECFIIQDVDGDDIVDLVKYNSRSATVYFIKNNKLDASCPVCEYTTESVFMPVKSSYGCFAKLIKISKDNIQLLRLSRDDTKESMLTKVVGSLGAIDKNYYEFLGESASYKKGNDAVFPYLNIGGRIPVVIKSETYVNGQIAYKSDYSYTNAVYHKQGMGFCGFGEIFFRNCGNDFVRTYMPYNRCLLKKEWSLMGEKSYTYSVDVQTNKIAKIRLTEKKEEDFLKEISSTSNFTYDTYGYPITEQISYNDGTYIKKKYSYSRDSIVGNGYHLGFLTDKSVTTTRGGLSYTERFAIPSYTLGLPNTKIYYKDGNQVKRVDYEYDRSGNPLTETLRLYDSQNVHTTRYVYDSYGRVCKETDPMGRVREFLYNTSGLLAQEKDHRGGITQHVYDAFGRETCTVNPDNTRTSIKYSWDPLLENAVYRITRLSTGKPEEISCYDALGNEVRHSEKRFDGTIINVDKIYDDIHCNLSAVSTPYTGDSPYYWDGYLYDSYGRLEYYQSETRDSETSYVYDGNSTTVIEEGKSVTKSYDPLGNLVSVADSAGTVTYNLAPDGQPMSVTAPGDVTTSFGYDKYRRRISLSDPSLGTILYRYDESGNLAEETNADGLTTRYTYDDYDRLIKKVCPEFTTDYSYDSTGDLTKITTSNGTSKSFTYDVYGRLSAVKESIADGKWLQKDYTYSDGNVSSIRYTSQSGVLATENYIYSNGHLSEVKLNNATTLFKLISENVYGRPTQIVTGDVTRKYGYSDCGLPSGRSAQGLSKTYHNTSYTFNPKTSYLESRVDSISGANEGFTYDNLGRLKSSRVDLFRQIRPGFRDSLIDIGPIIVRPLANSNIEIGSRPDLPGLEQIQSNRQQISYDIKGNITSKTDAGTFEYDIPSKPYAVSGLTVSGKVMSASGVPMREQHISYFSFGRPKSIEENGYAATFTYNGDCDRVKMLLSHNDTVTLARYYLGGCYEIDETSSSVKEKLYLCGGYYDAVAAYVKEDTKAGVYNILRDYLGSITQIVAPDGNLVQNIRYDAWGRMCNLSGTPYFPGNEPELFLGRGYTGHEHLPQFGLVNMNARLYDPVLGRFLSPDPYVQMPDMSQNFNRYSYAMNNPLCYVDENGEIWWVVAGAVIGGVANVAYKAMNGQINSWTDGFVAFGIGAVAGAVGGAFSLYAFAAAGGAAAGVGGFWAGMTSGAVGSAVSLPIENVGNHMYFGDPLMSLGEYSLGILGGALVGGTLNGLNAAYHNRNFWNGSRPSLPSEAPILHGERTISFESSVEVPKETGDYKVYHGYDENKNVRYVGITKREPEIRFKEHLRSGTERSALDYRVKEKGHTHIGARIREQEFINRYGGIGSESQLLNMRNEISPKYWQKYGIVPFKVDPSSQIKGFMIKK